MEHINFSTMARQMDGLKKNLHDLRNFELNYILKKLFFKNNKKLKNNYKKTINYELKQSPFFIGRHGSIGSTFDEFSLFNPINYFKILDKLNLEYESFKIPLIYSGHYFFGSSFSLKLRNKFSNILGYSCHCFVIKKND